MVSDVRLKKLKKLLKSKADYLVFRHLTGFAGEKMAGT